VRKSRYSDKEIADTVRQAEAGESVIDIVRKLGADLHLYRHGLLLRSRSVRRTGRSRRSR
jgi:hypothetical protein